MKAAEEVAPAPPARVARRTSASVKSVNEEVVPAPPARVARRTSTSVKSVNENVDMEAPQTPPPVPTSLRHPVRRPTSPPIITALPLIVPAPESEEDVERGKLLSVVEVTKVVDGTSIGRTHRF